MSKRKKKVGPVVDQIVQKLNEMGIDASLREPDFADFELGFIGFCQEENATFIHFFSDVPPSFIARVSRNLASINGWIVHDEPLYLEDFSDGAELLFGCEAVAAYAHDMLAKLQEQKCPHASEINN